MRRRCGTGAADRKTERAGFEPAVQGYTPYDGLANRCPPHETSDSSVPRSNRRSNAQQPDPLAMALADALADALAALPEADRAAVVAHVAALAKLSPGKRAAMLTLTRE
ncbi:MAG: hypothetical protein WD042_12105 [Phycisphaeraceae bacterium]